jgi:signal transduction histidine kinase
VLTAPIADGAADPRAIRIGRPAVLTVSAVLLALYVAGLALWLHRAADLPEVAHAPWSSPAGRAVLAEWGVPVRSWVAYLVVLNLAVAIAAGVAAWLVLRASVSWFRLYLAFTLVLFATAGSELALVLDALYPQLGNVGSLVQGIAWAALLILAYVFPDGRFVPRWSRWLIVVWGAYLLAHLVVGLTGGPQLAGIGDATAVALAGSAAVAQIYRYRKVSGPIEQRQIRWVLVALALWFLLGLILNVTPLQAMNFEASPRGLVTYAVVYLATTVVLMLIPTAIAVAILRHRLFDIDAWLSRGLVYAVLTFFVVGIYAAVVSGIGGLWAAGGTTSRLLAAGLIAVTFSPLRERVQRRVDRFVYGDRENPYRALSRLARRLGAVVEPEALAPSIVAAVRRALRAPYVAVSIGTPGRVVARAGRETAEYDVFPLRHRDEQLGELVVGRRPGEHLSSTDHTLLADLAAHSGTALYAAQESLRMRALAADLQDTRQRLVTAREEERRRLRRDLHDSLGPALGSQALTIDAARTHLGSDPAAAEVLLRDLKAQSQQLLAEVRQLARRLRPPALDEVGLTAALENLAAQYRRQGLDLAVPGGSLRSAAGCCRGRRLPDRERGAHQRGAALPGRPLRREDGSGRRRPHPGGDRRRAWGLGDGRSGRGHGLHARKGRGAGWRARHHRGSGWWHRGDRPDPPTGGRADPWRPFASWLPTTTRCSGTACVRCWGPTRAPNSWERREPACRRWNWRWLSSRT